MSKQLVLVVITVIFLIATLIVNYISTQGGINGQSQTDLSSKYSTPITPPGWAFSIWGLIYLWQTAWIAYLLFLSIAKRSELKESGKVTFTVSFYMAWCCSCIGNVTWIISFAYENQTVCLFALLFTAISLYLLAYDAIRYIGLVQIAKVTDNEAMKQNFLSYEVDGETATNKVLVAYKVLVANGITFYATWLSVASCLGLTIFWIYVGDADQLVSALFSLAVLTVIFTFYLFLDLFYYRPWLIDVYGPYPVLLWALSAIATKPTSDDLPADSPVRTWCFVLVGVAAVALIAKIISAALWYSKGALSGYLSNRPANAALTAVQNTDYQAVSAL